MGGVSRFFRKAVTCVSNCTTSRSKCVVLILINLGASSLLRFLFCCMLQCASDRQLLLCKGCRWVKNYQYYWYMFCSWLNCWLGMTKYTLSAPLLPFSCRCDLDSPFLSWVFAINMDTPNFICTKEEQRAVIHFCRLKVYQVSKCIEWCQCSMGTVSCHKELSVNGARGSKIVAQALSMGKEPDANPYPLLMQTLPTLLKLLRN